MKLHYFEETDTLYVQLTDNAVAETREFNENLYVDLDSQDGVVSLTVEHARGSSRKLDFSYEVTQAGEAFT